MSKNVCALFLPILFNTETDLLLTSLLFVMRIQRVRISLWFANSNELESHLFIHFDSKNWLTFARVWWLYITLRFRGTLLDIYCLLVVLVPEVFEPLCLVWCSHLEKNEAYPEMPQISDIPSLSFFIYYPNSSVQYSILEKQHEQLQLYISSSSPWTNQ